MTRLMRLMLTAACLLPAAAIAHPGGLDASGCHHDRRNGGYHCHRGPSAPAPAPRPSPRPAPAPQRVFTPPPVPAPPANPTVLDAGPSGQAAPAGLPPIVGRATVLDGDTIQIGSQRIRLWGIDAFEAAQTCNGAGGRTDCGARATHELTGLIGDNDVICVQRDIDVYQRVVAVCRVGATDLGATMVRRGHATAFTRYAQDYVPDEALARTERIGAWDGSFIPPSNYRAGERDSVAGAQRSQAPVTGACVIKGNINRNGERIYHLPNDPYYSRTNPEAMFCSEDEARAAGFRHAGEPR